MFPFPIHRPSTPESLQRGKSAEYARELQEYLDTLTPEARARFWADIEGTGDDQGKEKPSGK
jgi:hypothetical protein